MRKLRWLLLCGLLPLVCLAACAMQPEAAPEQETPDKPAPVFWLDELPPASPQQEAAPGFYLDALPDLPPYQPVMEIAARYYPEVTKQLRPRDNYGPLYPYIGRLVREAGWVSVYGLCDASGKIVVDPVFASVQRFQREDGTELLFLEYLPQPAADDSAAAPVTRCAVAAADGSWVVEGLTGAVRYADDAHIVTVNNSLSEEAIFYGVGDIYTYDYTGNELAKIEQAGLICCWQGIYVLIKWSQSEAADEGIRWDASITDMHGTPLPNLPYAYDQQLNDRAVRIKAPGSALYGLLGQNGVYLEPQYTELRYLEALDYYAAETADGVTQLLRADGSAAHRLALDGWHIDKAYADQGAQYLLLCNAEGGKYKLLELKSRQESPVWEGRGQLRYLRGGMYATQAWDDEELVIHDFAGDAEPRRIADVRYHYYLPEGGDVMILGASDDAGLRFYDLSSGEFRETYADARFYDYIEGMGYLLDSADGFLLVDGSGAPLRAFDSRWDIRALGDGLYGVLTQDGQAGVIDTAGNWLLRLNVQETD